MPNWSRVFAAVFASKPAAKPDSKHLRILIHGVNYAPEIIGVGKYTTELAEHLAARNRVEVVTAAPHYPGWAAFGSHGNRYSYRRENDVSITHCPLLMRRNGSGVWRLLAPLSFAAAAAPVVIWRALRLRPHIVICVEPTLFCAPAVLLAAFLTRAQAVLHVQDLEIDAAFATGHLRGRRKQAAARWCEGALLRRFDMVVAICDSMASRLRTRAVDSSRMVVIRNWVDRERLRPRLPPGTLRAALQLPDDVRIVLYAGHLGKNQGLPTLLDACARLARCETMHFVIAGEGPLAAMVRETSARLPNLTLLPLQPADRLGDLLAMADLHVLPQDAAAADLVFPSKLGGLLVSGKPIVVTANHGTELASWLAGAATVVPAGNAADLADAIATVADNPHGPYRVRATALASQIAAETLLPRFETVLREVWSKAAELADAPFEVWYPTEAEKLV